MIGLHTDLEEMKAELASSEPFPTAYTARDTSGWRRYYARGDERVGEHFTRAASKDFHRFSRTYYTRTTLVTVLVL